MSCWWSGVRDNQPKARHQPWSLWSSALCELPGTGGKEACLKMGRSCGGSSRAGTFLLSGLGGRVLLAEVAGFPSSQCRQRSDSHTWAQLSTPLKKADRR